MSLKKKKGESVPDSLLIINKGGHLSLPSSPAGMSRSALGDGDRVGGTATAQEGSESLGTAWEQLRKQD